MTAKIRFQAVMYLRLELRQLGWHSRRDILMIVILLTYQECVKSKPSYCYEIEEY